MKTVTGDIIGTGDEAYEDFIADMVTQLDGFRAHDEPSIEFARRYVGLCASFIDDGIRRKKLRLS